MKLTNTQNMKAKSGMTLLELTVVILVLLSLISILFIGARAWKKGSDRSASILTIRNTQQAVRSFANMNGKNNGDAILASDIFGAGKFVATDPTGIQHPGGAGLTYVTPAPTVVPETGDLYLEVAGASAGPGGEQATYFMPAAGATADW